MFGIQQFSSDWVYFTSHLKHTHTQPVREHLNLENSVCRLWIDNMLDDSSEEEAEKEGLESNFHTDSRSYPESPSQLASGSDQGMNSHPQDTQKEENYSQDLPGFQEIYQLQVPTASTHRSIAPALYVRTLFLSSGSVLLLQDQPILPQPLSSTVGLVLAMKTYSVFLLPALISVNLLDDVCSHLAS